MTTSDLQSDLLALLRAYAAEEYQRDGSGEPTNVWTLLGELEELLEARVINFDDPTRWLAPDSSWRPASDAGEPAARVETDVRRLRRDATSDRAWQRSEGNQGGPG